MLIDVYFDPKDGTYLLGLSQSDGTVGIWWTGDLDPPFSIVRTTTDINTELDLYPGIIYLATTDSINLKHTIYQSYPELFL